MPDTPRFLPHTTVATVIERSGQFLLVEEVSQGIAVLNQPAGHLEQHESLIDACLIPCPMPCPMPCTRVWDTYGALRRLPLKKVAFQRLHPRLTSWCWVQSDA